MSGQGHYLDCTSAMKRSYSLCTWVSGGGSEGKGGCAGLGPPPGVAFAPVAIPGAPPYIPALNPSHTQHACLQRMQKAFITSSFPRSSTGTLHDVFLHRPRHSDFCFNLHACSCLNYAACWPHSSSSWCSLGIAPQLLQHWPCRGRCMDIADASSTCAQACRQLHERTGSTPGCCCG